MKAYGGVGWKYSILNVLVLLYFAYFIMSHIYVIKKFSRHRESILYSEENIGLITGTNRKVS
jgi:hypothetical protein